MQAMRMLFGALALAASILHTGNRAGQVETLYTSPAHRTIAAFAQDGGLVAWFAPDPRRAATRSGSGSSEARASRSPAKAPRTTTSPAAGKSLRARPSASAVAGNNGCARRSCGRCTSRPRRR